ncbi:MAG: beta-ketoacyl-ACP synthase III [Trueperaceae bacterium]|nr:beta-ketoacyl-ACP synthase III [Trueperaceae bacterium]
MKRSAGITAIGAYAPEKVVTNDDLSRFLDTNDEWIRSRTGIRRRHLAADDEFASHMAFAAVDDLVRRYGEAALQDVDLVIVATNTPDALFPATASLVQDRFGLRAGAFDLLAACPGWVYALSVAQAYVESGLASKVLTVGSDALSKVLDWTDRRTAVLFGDGAGAAIVEAVPAPHGIHGTVLGSDGAGGGLLHVGETAPSLPTGEAMSGKLEMNGREVYKFAVRVMNDTTLEALGKAGLEPADVDLFVPHQANQRIIDAGRERLGLPPEKVVSVVDEYGNASTASIPMALVDALDAGRLRDGDRALLVSFGGGLSWATTVLTWGPMRPALAGAKGAA